MIKPFREPSRRQNGHIRLVTYNVHRCLGIDNVLSPHRIAQIIAACDPDIVALQELDVSRKRTGGIDQAGVIAGVLKMSSHFHPAVQVMEEQYGDAILTAWPSRMIQGARLPGLPWLPQLEPRGAVWASIDTGHGTIQVINTHLGLVAQERTAQARALLGSDWLGHADCRDPLVLMGDFNAGPGSSVYRLLTARLKDARMTLPGARYRPTFPAPAPVLRIDHVFVSSRIEIAAVEILRIPAAMVASDHLPMVVDIVLNGSSKGASATDATHPTDSSDPRDASVR